MTWLDLVVVAVLALAMLNGVRRGFLLGVLDLFTIVVALVAGAALYHAAAASVVHRLGFSTAVTNLLAFASVALLAQLFAWLVIVLPLGPFVQAARHLPLSHQLDGALGAIPGLVKGIALAATLLLASSLLPLGPGFDSSLAHSVLAQRVLSKTTQATARAQQRVGFNLADFTSVTSNETEAPVKLPHTYTNGLTVNTADEETMLRLLNQERLANGLNALTSDPNLQSVARAHSEEMLKLGYFAHQSPVSGSPADRLQAAGIHFTVAGENLAFAPSVDIAHRGLMNSPGHRANILSPEYHKVGIGVVVAPTGEEMFTQDFTN